MPAQETSPSTSWHGDAVVAPDVLAESLASCSAGEKAPIRVPSPQGRGCVGKKANVAAVIVAGGSGERFGHPGGKQLLDVCGKPLLTWSIEAFDAVSQVGRIVVVVPPDRVDEYRAAAVDPFGFVTPVDVVPGGGLRQESAMRGVEAVPASFKFIAMHDGARPLVLPDTIVHVVNVLKGTLDADGAVCGHAAIDTLKVVDAGAVVGTPDRSMFFVAQTPQVFHADVLRQAHQAAMEEGFVGTDDSSLVERVGGRVVLVTCPRDNIKLTVPEDLAPVSAFLRQRYGLAEG
jgi:2-C-methyl-D-erythritol 4-phosphate cytidylyltransferase